MTNTAASVICELAITVMATDLQAKSEPNLLRISPVPWRKLYLRQFLEGNKIRFPEGAYFFEDNSFHWNVMLKAKSVSVLDKVLVHHRRGQ